MIATQISKEARNTLSTLSDDANFKSGGGAIFHETASPFSSDFEDYLDILLVNQFPSSIFVPGYGRSMKIPGVIKPDTE